MKNILIILIIFVSIGMVGFLIYNFKFKMPEEVLETIQEELSPKIEGVKRAALIVAFRGFRDEEYFSPREVLENGGVEVVTCSDKEGVAIGADGGEAKIDLSLENLVVQEFDAIAFIGGPNALAHLDNEKSYKIAREAVEANKVLGAICISPTILAKAGVLEGKKATVWHSVLNKEPIKVLQENGAIFEDKPVVVDGKIVTANGPSAAREFGEKLLELLR